MESQIILPALMYPACKRLVGKEMESQHRSKDSWVFNAPGFHLTVRVDGNSDRFPSSDVPGVEKACWKGDGE